MNRFYNPYAFVPLSQIAETKRTCSAEIATGQHPFVRHDRWAEGALSGRIVCQLTLLSPTVVGNEHREHHEDDNNPKLATRVEPYCRVQANGQSEYALPASSLRGMLSVVTETLSQSAMRVLNRTDYSVRQAAGAGALSAIGRLERTDDGQWQLRPLCLPTLSRQTPSGWAGVFRRIPLREALQVYADQLASGAKLDTLNSYQQQDNPGWYYARVSNELAGERFSRFADLQGCSSLRHPKHQNRAYAIGQKLHSQGHPDLIDEVSWQALPVAEQRHYIRGVLYISGVNLDSDNKPKTKYHERFVPLTDQHLQPDHRCLPVSDQALSDFQRTMASRVTLQTERERHRVPYPPQGYELTPQQLEEQYSDTGYRPLKPGDLIYFDINRAGTEVTRLSYSGIWREALAVDSHALFSQAADSPDILPWQNLARQQLTPAEALFGVVEDIAAGVDISRAERKPFHLAGRLRFSDARGEAIRLYGQTDNSDKPATICLLPKLAAPKPPSPALYFKGGMSGQQLVQNKAPQPLGRSKVYLPPADLSGRQRRIDTRNPEQNRLKETPSWQSILPVSDAEGFAKNRDLHMACTPLADGQTLYFHIDFDNLSPAELGLLLTALKPSDNFRHRLGLGKPLGLGQIQIKPVAVMQVDRQQRYSLAGMQAGRYSSGWQNRAIADQPAASVRTRYRAELEATASAMATLPLQTRHGGLVDPDALGQLQFLGDPANQEADTPVSYPYTAQQGPWSEQELFKWGVANKKQGQGLADLSTFDTGIQPPGQAELFADQIETRAPARKLPPLHT